MVLRCHKSSSFPTYRVGINDLLLIDEMASDEFVNLDFEVETSGMTQAILYLEHYGKQDIDTHCDAEGNIIADRAVELQSLSIDGYQVPKNIIFSKKFYPNWPPHFDITARPRFITQNNFFGFNGRYEFDFKLPMAQEYYGYFWQMEIDANRDFTKVDDKEEYFEAYGMKIKIDQDLNFNLTDLKNLINQHEK